MANPGKNPTKRALILAAGQGRPIASVNEPNCLVHVDGLPLIERTLMSLVAAGIRDVAITVGFEASRVEQAIRSTVSSNPRLATLKLVFFENSRFTEANGLSVLSARSHFDAPVLIVMADQIAAPHLVAEMAALPVEPGRITIGVDREIARVFDLADATKVQVAADGHVLGISKALETYDAISTSLIVADAGLIASLDALPSPSLTEGLAHAAAQGSVVAHDVGGALWQDVDSVEMRTHANWLLRVHGPELVAPSTRNTTRSTAAETMALVERLVADKDIPGLTLFTPGPVMTSARVKAALVHRDISHRDVGYEGVIQNLRTKLKPIFRANPEHEIVVVTGSGTAAMELCVLAAVPPGKKLLVVQNGAFGERLVEMANVHGMNPVVHARPWGQLPDVAQIDALLKADPDIAAVAMTHHETSVGLLNPISALGAVCKAHDVLFIVDAVSSLGAEDLDVVRDNIDLCYSSANKCLHAIAGVSFACVSPRVWPRLEKITVRSYYLNLARYRKYHAELNQTPFTPAVSTSIALDVALDELEESGGVPARNAVYRWRNLRIRQALAGLGFASFTNTGHEAHSVCTLRIPENLDIEFLYSELRTLGFVVYRAKGELANGYVQIANMGEIPDADIDDFLAAVTDVTARARDRAVARVAKA